MEDDKVRSQHRRLNGRILTSNDLDQIGWPENHFGCRCRLEPYIENETEYFNIDTGHLEDAKIPWDDANFVWHYYFGKGQRVTLGEIGHLRQIVDEYAYRNGGQGAYYRLACQIANAARKSVDASFWDHFEGSYPFRKIAFSHGDSVVRGLYLVHPTLAGAGIRLDGRIEFNFVDEFTDPLDLRDGLGFEGEWTEIGGTPYTITGSWTASFSAFVLYERAISRYVE